MSVGPGSPRRLRGMHYRTLRAPHGAQGRHPASSAPCVRSPSAPRRRTPVMAAGPTDLILDNLPPQDPSFHHVCQVFAKSGDVDRSQELGPGVFGGYSSGYDLLLTLRQCRVSASAQPSLSAWRRSAMGFLPTEGSLASQHRGVGVTKHPAE